MQTENVVRTATQAYNNGDLDRVAEFIDEGMRYFIASAPGVGPYFADTRGRNDFFDAVGRIRADWNIDRFEMLDLVVNGNRAASRNLIHATNRHSGQVIESENALFWTIENDRVTELREFHDTALYLTAQDHHRSSRQK